MAGVIASIPKFQFSNALGLPMSGGTLTSYLAGTTTPVTTYQDEALTSANTNPISLDSRGECLLWLDSTKVYKFVLKNALGVTQWTVDNITNSTAFAQAVQDNLTDLIADLAASSGSSLVGHISLGTGASATTVQAKLREIVSVKDFGAVGNGVTDDSTHFQNAIDHAGTGVGLYVPSGTYIINTPLTSSNDLHMFGDGDTSILDFSGISASSSSGISVTGSITSLGTISSAVQGNHTVTFSSAPALATNDVFALFDDSVLWNTARAYYYSGEFCQCRSASGTTIRTTNELYDGYSAVTAIAYKLNSKSVSFRDLKMIGGTGMLGVLKISMCDAPYIANLTIYAESYQAVEFNRCYLPKVLSCDVYNKGTGTLDDYGVLFSNCQKASVDGGEYYARRHGIAISGGDYDCAVVNRDVRISNARISNDILSGVFCADMHGNCEDVVYQGCQIYEGGGIAGMNTGYDNCKIYAMTGGVVIQASEVKGGLLFMRNCNFSTLGNAATVSRGVLDFGGNSSVMNSSVTQETTIAIENCHLHAPFLTSSSSMVVMYNQGSTTKINIKINGITTSAPALSAILRTNLFSGTADSRYIIVDNISTFPTATKLHNAVGSHYLNFPHKLQRQTGYVSISTVVGTPSTNLATASFKYEYPRAPVGSASIGQTSNLGVAGNYYPIPGFSQLTATGYRANIATGGDHATANFSAAVTYGFNWTVSIDEV